VKSAVLSPVSVQPDEARLSEFGLLRPGAAPEPSCQHRFHFLQKHRFKLDTMRRSIHLLSGAFGAGA